MNSFDSHSFDTVYMVPNRSTIEMDVYDDQDRVQYHETYVFTGASSGVPTFEELNREYFVYLFGKLHFHSDLYGLREINWMSDGIPSGRHENDGEYEQYQTDANGRYTGTIKWYLPADTGYAAQDHLYTNWTRDAANRILTEQISSADGTTTPDDAVTNAYVYNRAGLITSQTAESGSGNFTTTTDYYYGGRVVTQTLPGGFTITTDHYLDGSVKSITGTGVIPEYHSATVNTGGTITQEVHVATSTDARWKKVTADWAGRAIKEESPAYSSGTFTREYFYNSVGQLTKTTETGLADKLVEYNAWQQPYRQGLNVDGTAGLSVASGGTDRVTDVDTIFEKVSSNWWLKTTTKVYNDSGTAITTSVSKQRLTGYNYGTNSGNDANIASETVTTDVFGNTTTHTVDIHRGSGSGPTGDWDVRLVTDKVTYPDSTTPQVAITRNGLLQMATSKEGLVSRYYYDVRRRLISQTDNRIDGSSYLTSPPIRIGYVTNSDRIDWQKDTAGKQTSFAYDATTGRLTSTTDPLGKVAYQSYTDLGQIEHVWGDTAYPVEYGYDAYGAQTTMKTYRGGSGWTGSSWPGSPGTADTTTWTYEAATGLLTRKTDAASKYVDYTYNSRGQLATRTWARGVSATYSYDSATAEQTGINYSDSTPDLTYTYNRLGQTATVADVTGTRTFAYDGTTSVLNTETYPSYFESRVMTRQYDTSGSGHLPGRNIGYTLSAASGSGTDNAVSYSYDNKGRFSGVTVPSSGPVFTYSFAPNSNLVGSISETSGWTESNTFESDRNLLSQISGQYGSPVKAQFAYTHDDLGRRLTATDSGEIFARYNSGALTTHYGYNDRSEVTSAQSYYGTDPNDTSSPVIDRGWGYAFDNIGNRTSSSVIGNGGGDTHTTSYTVNNLNQVTARTGPGSVDVTGLASSSATVTVNSSSATRQGEYYYKNVTVGSPPAWQSLAASDGIGGSETRHSFVPGSSETHTYDDDGNLTADGRWNYTWDAENRLVSMETVSGAYSVGVPRQFIQFKYDYLGRRVRKTVANWNSMTSTYDATLDRKFLYNGWNLLAEYDVGTGLTMASAYVWGLDLSGNLVDGGGVGGLLAIKQVSGSVWHLPYYDANGNLHALVDRSTGTVTAAYEYSPFGETLRANGIYAASNPFRFSTKYADTETHLLYYGYRYYDPYMGRWLGRDPLEEKGGLHLYAFCRNNAVNAYDALGMVKMDDIWDEDMPDDDFVATYQPTWQRVGGNSWYDPATDTQRNYMGHSQAYYDSLVDGSSLDLPIWASWGQAVMDSDDAANAAWRGSNTADTDEFLSNKAIGDGTLISNVISAVIGAVSNAIDAVEEALSPGVKSGNVSFGPLEVVPDATLAQQGYSSGSVTASATTSAASSGRASDPTLSNAGSAGTAETTASNSRAGGIILTPYDPARDPSNPEFNGHAGMQDQTLAIASLVAVPPVVKSTLGAAFGWVGAKLGGLFGRGADAEAGLEAGALTDGAAVPTRCFPAGTKVSTPKGDVNIENIKVGDTVYACDLQTGATVERNVTELLHNFTYHWVDVQVGAEVIRATRSHPFWIESKQDWVETADLKSGMVVRLENGHSAAITSVAMIDLQQPQPTYNFEVAVNHDYFVSGLHVLVHNGEGSYTITFASGRQYVGKGDLSRMADSAARLSAQTGDRVVSTNWTPANGTVDSFVQEEMRMRAAGGPGGSTYNKINSPGNNIAAANGCP